MKKYNDYMNELTPDDIYIALLGYGMFSGNLPPFLTSKSFFDYCQKISHSFPKQSRQFVYYENIRNINIPRSLGIPNPMAYQILCKCIKDNWTEIQEYFEKITNNQKYNVSRIHIQKIKDKNHVFEMNYSNWIEDPHPNEDLLIDNYYIVNADISKCFASIYTHSIPWAVLGKETAKANKNNGKHWSDKLDMFVRNTNYGETHGLMIGPHASNLISEIILSKIDEKLIQKGWTFIRNIDDYTGYIKSEEEARQFLIDLQMELRYFKLALNHKKTKIRELPLATAEHWVRKINSISIITNYGKVDYKNCCAYLDFAIETAKNEGGNSAVLKYAIKVLSGKELTNNAKLYFQKTVFHLCLIFPYLIPLLETNVFICCKTSAVEIKNISNKLYNNNIKNRVFEASSYALFFAIKYNFHINTVSVEDLIRYEDCILLLLGYRYFLSINDKEAIEKVKLYAESLLKDKESFDANWLLIYEVMPQTSLEGDWKALKNGGVSFIRDVW